MDKLTLAHDWAMKHGSAMTHKTVIDAWAYADAMQAEADERNNTERPKVLLEPKFEVDWSQSPDDAVAWVYSNVDKSGFWCHKKPIRLSRGWCTSTMLKKAPSFNYQGNWQDSLRERPQ